MSLLNLTARCLSAAAKMRTVGMTSAPCLLRSGCRAVEVVGQWFLASWGTSRPGVMYLKPGVLTMVGTERMKHFLGTDAAPRSA